MANVRLGLTSVPPLSTPRLLARVPVGSTAVVTRVTGSRPVVRRLLEMGLVPGTPVTVQRQAPLGDPMELRVRNYASPFAAPTRFGIEVER